MGVLSAAGRQQHHPSSMVDWRADLALIRHLDEGELDQVARATSIVAKIIGLQKW